VGLLLNAFFGDRSIISLDGVNTTVDGGFMNHNWAALYKQVCYILATCGYTFVVTALIAKGVDMIPGLCLRAGPVDEALGMDEVEVGSGFHFIPLPTSLKSSLARRIRHRLHRASPGLYCCSFHHVRSRYKLHAQ